ncbi:DUF192 domain-containing protein [Candidatus Uhrbacteria bacterium]|nr:DUF192 domain-containing protein [Candidatus Uhrbacteria bacterium]
MQKVLLAVFAIILLAGCGRLLFDKAAITWSDGRVLLMDVARTQEAREQGLSGREDIGDGMIFCFEDDAVRYFWMYDMRVPLDVVWLRDV